MIDLRDLVARATTGDLPAPDTLEGIQEWATRGSYRQQLDELSPALAVLVADAKDLLEKTIYSPPGWTGPGVWWKPEADALLARIKELEARVE